MDNLNNNDYVLKIWWATFWRTVVVLMAIGVVLGIIIAVSKIAPEKARILEQTVTAIGTFIASYFIIKGVFIGKKVFNTSDGRNFIVTASSNNYYGWKSDRVLRFWWVTMWIQIVINIPINIALSFVPGGGIIYLPIAIFVAYFAFRIAMNKNYKGFSVSLELVNSENKTN